MKLKPSQANDGEVSEVSQHAAIRSAVHRDYIWASAWPSSHLRTMLPFEMESGEFCTFWINSERKLRRETHMTVLEWGSLKICKINCSPPKKYIFNKFYIRLGLKLLRTENKYGLFFHLRCFVIPVALIQSVSKEMAARAAYCANSWKWTLREKLDLECLIYSAVGLLDT